MDDLSRRLAGCYTGVVFDILRQRGVIDTVLPTDVRPVAALKTLAGPVFTMAGSPKSHLDAHQTLLRWTEFLTEAPAGHVAISAGQDDDRALMGELSAETLQFRGVRGYITDGGCRDCGHITRMGFPVFARFRTPRDVVGAWTPDTYQQPLDFRGVVIRPGDYVLADIDGAVLIPGAMADGVVFEAEEAMQKENLVRKAILEGVSPREAYLRFGKF